MDDSLEALLEKATNPRNRYEDWEFIMAFCDHVNTEPEGPQVALKIIVPKMRHDNEKVALLSLTLLEACVKNCGQRFHQELGKFRFLNELIRMISPKYLGTSTPPNVLKKIKELLYSWKIGLPNEPKIADAYEMLKKEGLVFDETRPADRTLEAISTKPKVALIEEPRQSEMLQRLLSSKNPDDLRAANRLIREMVRRDDKRMERLKQRLDELELIQNNIKLLNELLSHYRPDSREDEKLLIKELYSSLDKMKPNLFRMASDLKQNEEGMAEILQANDNFIRVSDLYKRVIGDADSSPTTSSTATSNGTITTTSAATTSQSGATATATASGSDILIDLADLDLGPPPSSHPDSNTTSASGSLLDSLGLLNLQAPTTSQDWSSWSIPSLTSPPMTQPTVQTIQPPMTQPTVQPIRPPMVQPTVQPIRPPMVQPIVQPIQPPMVQPIVQPIQPPMVQPIVQPIQPPMTQPTVQPIQPWSIPPLTSPPSTRPTVQPIQQPLLMAPGTTSTLSPSTYPTPLITLPPPPQGAPIIPVGQTAPKPFQQPAANTSFGTTNLLGNLARPEPGGRGVNIQPIPPRGPTVVGSDPLASLNEVFVPLDSIQPGILPPLQVMSKNGVTVTFHFAKNSPSPSVCVIVISIISTSPSAITNFQFQAAVPKVMRLKLQPPTGTDLGAYNPILPPPSISQVMLLANPTKAKIRLKYRISYHLAAGQEVVEIGDASDFPNL